MCDQKLYSRHDFHSGAKAIRHIACEQALLFGLAKQASRESASEAPRGFAARSRVHARLASLAQIRELARRLSGIVWTLSYITTALPSVVHSVQQDLLLEYQVLLLRHLWLPNNELFHHENSAESTKYDRWSTLLHKRAYWAINFCWTFRLLCPTFGSISAFLSSSILFFPEKRGGLQSSRPKVHTACFVSPYHHCVKTRLTTQLSRLFCLIIA